MFLRNKYRPAVGDHVALKGLGLWGYTATIVSINGMFIQVKFDEPYTRLGNSFFTIGRRNIKCLLDQPSH